MHPGAVQDSVITTLLFELTNDSQAESRAYSLIRKLKPTYMYVHVSLYNNRISTSDLAQTQTRIRRIRMRRRIINFCNYNCGHVFSYSPFICDNMTHIYIRQYV